MNPINFKPIFYIHYRKMKDYIPNEWTICLVGIWLNYIVVHRGTALFIKLWIWDFKISFPKAVDNAYNKWFWAKEIKRYKDLCEKKIIGVAVVSVVLLILK